MEKSAIPDYEARLQRLEDAAARESLARYSSEKKRRRERHALPEAGMQADLAYGEAEEGS